MKLHNMQLSTGGIYTKVDILFNSKMTEVFQDINIEEVFRVMFADTKT